MGTIAERLDRIRANLTETGEQAGQEGFPNRPDFHDVVTNLLELTNIVHDLARGSQLEEY
jgi:hypothetical protein